MRTLVAVLMLGAAGAVVADEGMWQPAQMPALSAQAKSLGMEIPATAVANLTGDPLGAVINLGKFCTASFVSPEGLIVTNHHCAFGTIQFNSTPERNLMADGFVAQQNSEELPADPTLRVYVTENIEDVTSPLLEGLDPQASGRERYAHIDRVSKSMIATCERTPNTRCDLYSFFGGSRFQLIRQMEIKDIRLVYAPSEKIGNFGDDVDNWMWPRHTGDFSFLRAYVGKNGKPATYSADNVPYRPKHWLKIAPQGLKEGEFAMVTGYPGRTNRTRLAEELEDVIAWQYPKSIVQSQTSIATITAASEGRADAAIKYAPTMASINNGLKNMQGQLEGFSHTTAVADKRAEEARLYAWIDANPDRQAAYADDIAALKTELARLRSTRERDLVRNPMFGFGGGGGVGQVLGLARDLYWVSRERLKPDADRLTGFQSRDEPRLEGRLKTLDKRYDRKVDRALLEVWLKRYLALPMADRVPQFDAWLGVGADGMPDDLSARIDALYAGSKLENTDDRMRWNKAKPADFEASKDSFIQLAVALYPVWDAARIENETRQGIDARYRARYLEAMLAYRADINKPLYADANGSLRVTIGKVIGYSPQDAVQYQPFTRLEGVLAKLGPAPFEQPEGALIAMREKRYAGYSAESLGTVPVNFLTNVDITGGNSGSPTLNSRGEFVGVVFDGNWESVSSNWVFNPELTRAIHVDVRYMLWVMDEVDHAEHLIREMGVDLHSP